MSNEIASRLPLADHGMPGPRRVRGIAILTVLGWNMVPLIALVVLVTVILSQRESGEDWSGLVAVILVVFGGTGIALAAAVGSVIAAIIMTRKLRAAQVSTTAAGFRWGTLSALLGWLAAAAILTVLALSQNMGIGIRE